MTDPVRTYLVINPSAVFGPGARITFRSAAPAGSVVTQVIGGRRVRVLLDDYVVSDDRGRRYFAAELHCYL